MSAPPEAVRETRSERVVSSEAIEVQSGNETLDRHGEDTGSSGVGGGVFHQGEGNHTSVPENRRGDGAAGGGLRQNGVPQLAEPAVGIEERIYDQGSEDGSAVHVPNDTPGAAEPMDCRQMEVSLRVRDGGEGPLHPERRPLHR